MYLADFSLHMVTQMCRTFFLVTQDGKPLVTRVGPPPNPKNSSLQLITRATSVNSSRTRGRTWVWS